MESDGCKICHNKLDSGASKDVCSSLMCRIKAKEAHPAVEDVVKHGDHSPSSWDDAWNIREECIASGMVLPKLNNTTTERRT